MEAGAARARARLGHGADDLPPSPLGRPPSRVSPLQVAHLYATSPRVARGVRYGRRPRNTLDLYFPPGVDARAAAAAAAAATRPGSKPPRPSSTSAPIIVYVTGGAWMIGHRAWGALLAHRAAARGAVVASVDYRNFPQAAASGMAADVGDAIAWVIAAAPWLGGDGKRVHVVGQSAGAHVAALALLARAAADAGKRLEFDDNTTVVDGGADGETSWPSALPPPLDAVGAEPLAPTPLPWRARDVASFVGVSGVYDPARLEAHLAARGLRPALTRRLFSARGAPALAALSPTRLAAAHPAAVVRMPPILLLHGTADASAPAGDAARFAEAVVGAGGSATLRLADGGTHTSPLIEDAFRGPPRDGLTGAVCAHVGAAAAALESGERGEGALCPGALVTLAAWVCPF